MVYLTDRISLRGKYYVTLLYSIIFSYICHYRRQFLNNFFLNVFFDSRRNKHPRWNIRCFPNDSLCKKKHSPLFTLSLSLSITLYLFFPVSIYGTASYTHYSYYCTRACVYLRVCKIFDFEDYVIYFFSEVKKTSIRHLLYRCIIFYAYAHTKQTQSPWWYYTDNL